MRPRKKAAEPRRRTSADSRRRRARRYVASLDRVRKAILGAGALAGALLAILALWTQIRGDDEDDETLQPEGVIDSVEVRQRHLTRGDYCREYQPRNEACLANGRPADGGRLFVVRVRFAGPPRPCCLLKYTVREVENDDAVPGFRSVPAAVKIGRTRNVPVWIPYPGAGNFYALFELEDEEGIPLDDARSPSFSPLRS